MTTKTYKIKFKSARNFSPEKGVKVTRFNHEWDFIDTKLGFPIKINLKEKSESGKAIVIAEIIFDKKFASKISEIDDYITFQLKYVLKDGMVKL
jgi:hypothetical protein